MLGESGARGRILQPRVQLQKGERGEMGRGEGGKEHPEPHLERHTGRYTAQERGHVEEKDKEGANGEEEEKEERHWASQRWT